ncbi:MAG: U-box domain-containing protein, partial [Gammaproteobacteria bacterium]|nr:U-box domain-containing protein [Gammaproteobacteria bacterium]
PPQPHDGQDRRQQRIYHPISIRSEAARSTVSTSDLAPEFICPITGEIMIDPVVAEDGRSYERAAIAEWFQRRFEAGLPPTAPLTGGAITPNLMPNTNLRNTIQTWLARHPEFVLAAPDEVQA